VGAEYVRKVYWLDRAGLDGPRKAALVCIAFHANHQTRRCTLKYRTIAQETGVSVRAIERAVPWLEANGYVATGSRFRRKNGTLGAHTFRLLPPATEAVGPPASEAGNLPTEGRRSNPRLEPTASSSTPTAEDEEAGNNP
jgi:Helix-turn-helix domain